MAAAEQHATTFDGATVAAAAATLVFAVSAGILLSNMPATGQLGGAIESLKNVVYVLTVPFFDISRRLIAGRRTRAVPAAGVQPPNLLAIAFVTSLLFFMITEALSFLVGAGIGTLCQFLGQQGAAIDFGYCLMTGLQAMGITLMSPLTIAIGFACGWIWQRLVGDGFWRALGLLTVLVGLLFAVDYLLYLRVPLAQSEGVQQAMANWGVLKQVGLVLILFIPSVAIGYGARRLWSALARTLSSA